MVAVHRHDVPTPFLYDLAHVLHQVEQSGQAGSLVVLALVLLDSAPEVAGGVGTAADVDDVVGVGVFLLEEVFDVLDAVAIGLFHT